MPLRASRSLPACVAFVALVLAATGTVSAARRRPSRTRPSAASPSSAPASPGTSPSSSSPTRAPAPPEAPSPGGSSATVTSTYSTPTTSTAGTTPAGTVDHSDRVARATVLVMVGEQVRARGVVLASDGRVVTDLASLAGQRTVTVRYPNGRRDSAAVVGQDTEWGLALLQPRGGAWQEGLPLATRVRWNTPARWVRGPQGQNPQVGVLRRRRTYVGERSALLRDAWEIDPAPGFDALGSGITNAAGELTAVIVPPAAGSPEGGAVAPFGAPTTVIEQMATAAGVTTRPWLGFIARNLRTEELPLAPGGAIRITTVSPSSPASEAGLYGGVDGDLLLGIDAFAIHGLADLARALEGRHPGDTVMLRLIRGDAVAEVPLRLGTPPPIAP